MTRAGAYGQSFALKHLHEGRPADALVEAEKAIAATPADPEPVMDRAQVHLAERRWQAALTDVERAMELDKVALVLDDSVVDDTLFSTLVGWASELVAREPATAIKLVERYGPMMPDGVHHDEATGWVRRFQGQVDTWVKPH
jgi:hypothetical protein